MQDCKNPLRDRAMSDATYVDLAVDWGKRLTGSEARGPGDMERAWRRLEARYGIPWCLFWALRYRKPTTITAYLFERLRAAYECECARQMRLLTHELAITKALTGPDDTLVVEASAVVEADKEEAGE